MKQTLALYKLLSIDLDGTLISPTLRKARKNDCLAIQDYMSCGGNPIINTGRSPWRIEKTLLNINKSGSNRIKLISCFNGAYIYDLNDNEIIENLLDNSMCRRLLDLVKKYPKASIWFYTKRSFPKKIVEIYPNVFYRFFHSSSKPTLLKDAKELASYKINIISPSKKVIAQIYRELHRRSINLITNISFTGKHIIEITKKGIDKGYAIKYYSNKYNIPFQEIASIGDSFNDEKAFNNSALSIAIKPKNTNLINYCDEVIERKALGVSNAIYKHIIFDTEVSKDIKLIFTDLDGTILDQETKVFSNATRIALQQVSNNLVPIALASGRCIQNEINILNQMKLNPKSNIFLIGNNGATIYDFFTKKYILERAIEPKNVKAAFKFLVAESKKIKGQGLGMIIHTHSLGLLFFNDKFWVPRNMTKSGDPTRYDPWADAPIKYIKTAPNDKVYKFVVKFPNKELADKYVKILSKKFSQLEICKSSDVNVDINKKGINKGLAFDTIIKQLNIPAANVLVMGDGENDIQALKKTKLSFCPAYASDEVKKASNYVLQCSYAGCFTEKVINNYVVVKTKRKGK